MKISSDKLAGQLSRGFGPLYVVTGDDVLLVQEASDQIREAARAAGFSEREVFHAEGSFDWEEVLFSVNAMSLFAERKLLEIRLPGGKPGDKGAAAIKTYTEEMSDDISMLLVLPRVDASTQRSKWFKALEDAGVVVQVWPIALGQMPGWIADRCRRVGLTMDRDAVATMVDRVEGNLLAAIQEIERLRLVTSGDRITLQHVLEGVADASRYDVFSLIDAAVAQDARRALKIVQGLRAEGAEILYITAMLAREVRPLTSMAVQVAEGKSIDAAISSARVWPRRKGLVNKCLRALGVADLLEIERRISLVDRMVKGIEPGDAWAEVTDVILTLAGASPLPQARRLRHR